MDFEIRVSLYKNSLLIILYYGFFIINILGQRNQRSDNFILKIDIKWCLQSLNGFLLVQIKRFKIVTNVSRPFGEKIRKR